MAHPSEFYIKYLLAMNYAGPQETWEDVEQTLKAFRLPGISEEDFKGLVSSFKPPAGFVFNNKEHLATADFMKSEKIFSLWKPTSSEALAFDLLSKPQVKDTVQILLMGRVDSEKISSLVSDRYGISPAIPPRSIQTYAHYLWNVDQVGFEDWAEHLRPYKRRDHYVAALAGQDAAMYRAGFDVEVDPKESLKNSFKHLYFRAEAARMLPDSKETMDIVSMAVHEMVHVYSAIYGDGAEADEILKKFKNIHMVAVPTNVLPIAQIAPTGNYSGSGGERV